MKIKTKEVLKNKWFWIVVIPIIIIASLLDESQTPEPTKKKEKTEKAIVVPDLPWEELTWEQKEAWIVSHFDGNWNGQSEFNNKVSESIKKQFNYPRTVKFHFGESPDITKSWVTDAENGLCFLKGSGYAKNAFGVEEDFSYIVRFILTMDEFKLDKVTVN